LGRDLAGARPRADSLSARARPPASRRFVHVPPGELSAAGARSHPIPLRSRWLAMGEGRRLEAPVLDARHHPFSARRVGRTDKDVAPISRNCPQAAPATLVMGENSASE